MVRIILANLALIFLILTALTIVLNVGGRGFFAFASKIFAIVALLRLIWLLDAGQPTIPDFWIRLLVGLQLAASYVVLYLHERKEPPAAYHDMERIIK